MGKNIFDQYTGKYSVSKTLRFELRPQGRTQEYIEKRGIIAEDQKRAEDYKKVKRIADGYHKRFIEEALSGLHLSDLDEYMMLISVPNKDDKDLSRLEKIEGSMRRQIVNCFREDSRFAFLFKKELITQELKEFTENKEELEAISSFQNFTTYFGGYSETRKNMYVEDAKSTAIAYRIVNQNLPKFVDNMRVFETIMGTELCTDMDKLQKQLSGLLNGRRVEDFFKIENYENTVTNADITLYNTLIGAVSLDDGTKIKGINEYVNEFNQRNKKDKSIRQIPKLKPLYKQILADRESLSFIDEQFEDDQQVLDTIQMIISEMKEKVLKTSGTSSVEGLLGNIADYDLQKIYILNGSAITDLSQAVLGDWTIIKKSLEKEYDALNSKKNKNEKYYEIRDKAIKNQKSFSIESLNRVVEKYVGKDPHFEVYYAALQGKDGKSLLIEFEEAYEKAEALLNTAYASRFGLASDKNNVAIIKQLLDAVKRIEEFVKPLRGSGMEAEKDDSFYGELDFIYGVLSEIIPLYNKVRNYVTRKPYSIEKIKLNFQNPTLLKGWDQNKERDNLALIFRKEGLYYLGIMDKKNNKLFLNDSQEESDDYYEKMEYKLLPGPNKMLPKVFFGKSNLAQFNPSEEILKNYEQGTHKLGDTFNVEKCHQLIDFFKESIDKHEDWKKFGFQFSDTKDYRDISQFYHEVEKQGYAIKFRKIDSSYIDSLVDEGKLYLFQIYNKDFSPYSKGKPNLHTKYWRMLFDEKNLSDVVYKLNGEAEVFYRKASISEDRKVIHQKGERVFKKNLKAKEKEEYSVFDYDLVKDRRYTVDKYQFHVPITMNFCAEGRNSINTDVHKTIRENPDMNVVGIDRGERNLLYFSVVSPEGKIICQDTLNVIENDKGYSQDYHKLLDKRETEMDQSKRNWMEVESIKELKEGYLSQAIHKITQLMIKYQAIVVLEDLNFGFMNGRKKVGKQVYQKFEKMLIDKLNYLVDKDVDDDSMGGTLHAYQLTNQFESFAKLGKQSGFLFYIPAWNTSKIDPTTGFVNLLYPKYTNAKEAKKFIRNFDAIRYNKEEGYFEFTFDYSKFTDKANGTRTNWTICSFGKRIVTFRNPLKNSEWDYEEVDITDQIRKHLCENGIDVEASDLIEAICMTDHVQLLQNILNDIRLVLQIRNSIPNTDIDYMLSPVKNRAGKFFDTREYVEGDKNKNCIPKNADANGAYNIARKGLWVMKQIRESQDDKVRLAMTNKEWLSYAQENTIV